MQLQCTFYRAHGNVVKSYLFYTSAYQKNSKQRLNIITSIIQPEHLQFYFTLLQLTPLILMSLVNRENWRSTSGVSLDKILKLSAIKSIYFSSAELRLHFNVVHILTLQFSLKNWLNYVECRDVKFRRSCDVERRDSSLSEAQPILVGSCIRSARNLNDSELKMIIVDFLHRIIVQPLLLSGLHYLV